MKVKIIIERALSGRYSAYMAESNKIPFGLLGEGNTISDTIEDFRIGYEEMREVYREQRRDFPELEFYFRYNFASFLEYYAKTFSASALKSIAGIHRKQLGITPTDAASRVLRNKKVTTVR
jgi:hypothetical protein